MKTKLLFLLILNQCTKLLIIIVFLSESQHEDGFSSTKPPLSTLSFNICIAKADRFLKLLRKYNGFLFSCMNYICFSFFPWSLSVEILNGLSF